MEGSQSDVDIPEDVDIPVFAEDRGEPVVYFNRIRNRHCRARKRADSALSLKGNGKSVDDVELETCSPATDSSTTSKTVRNKSKISKPNRSKHNAWIDNTQKQDTAKLSKRNKTTDTRPGRSQSPVDNVDMDSTQYGVMPSMPKIEAVDKSSKRCGTLCQITKVKWLDAIVREPTSAKSFKIIFETDPDPSLNTSAAPVQDRLYSVKATNPTPVARPSPPLHTTSSLVQDQDAIEDVNMPQDKHNKKLNENGNDTKKDKH